MKATTIFLLFLFVAFLVNAQDVMKSRMLEGVDVKPPVFTGIKGTKAILSAEASEFVSIYDYLQSNLEYPEKSKDAWREGRVIIRFTVLATGDVDDFQVINGVSSDIDREVIRVLKSTDGMWKPGKNDNTPVDMEKEVSITFQMEKSDHLRMAQKLFTRANKKLLKHKTKRALRLLDNALVYHPYSDALLFRRGVTRLAVGNKMGACEDWNRLKSLGYDVADDYLMEHCEEGEIALKDK
jgi:TonB family protein